MTFSSRVTGVKELDAKLKKLPKKLGRRAVLNALRPAARIIRDDIKNDAPVLTGDHKKSIKVKTRAAGKSQANSIEVFVGGDYKSNWLEYGSVHNSAHGHFRRGYDSKKNQAAKKIGDEIFAQIDKVMKS